MDDINYLHEKILYLEKQHNLPEFTSFNIKNINTETYEIGQSFPSNVSPYELIFNWETTYPERIQPESIKIENLLTGSILGTGLENTGASNFILNDIYTFVSPTDMNYRISAVAINGQTIEKEINLKWVDRIMWGIFPEKELDNNSISILNNSILLPSTSNFQKLNMNFLEAPNNYKVIVTPKRYPLIKVIDQKTSLDFIFDEPYELLVRNSFNLEIPYLVYVSSYKISSSLNLVAKFGEENYENK